MSVACSQVYGQLPVPGSGPGKLAAVKSQMLLLCSALAQHMALSEKTSETGCPTVARARASLSKLACAIGTDGPSGPKRATSSCRTLNTWAGVISCHLRIK